MKKVIVMAAVSLFVSGAFGAELFVPSQYSTIQSAIDASAAGDTVIISPGTYSGNGNYNIAFSGKAITVRSIDPNDSSVVESTVIDCNRLGSGFNIDAGVVLDGLTVTNGSTGIYITAGAPLIRNCNIRDNNTASYGAGVYCSGTSIKATIIDSNISGNSAALQGGGIFCWGSSITMTIIGSNISGNSSNRNGGGGIHCIGATDIITISDCSITENTSSSSGGGIYTSLGSMKITRSLIAGNIASGSASSNGGGINAASGTLDINNSIVAGNFAQVNGGGIYKTASVTMSNCTFAGNTATGLGGGIYLGSGGAFSAIHSIFWDNNDSTGVTTSAQIYPLPTPPSPSQMLLFCCIADMQNKFGGANNGNINDDPMFVREPNDGGDGWGVGGNDDYGDLHLRPDSPCIDKGNPLYVPGPNVTDIDGESRLTGSAVDMGADEYGKIIVVTKPAGGEIWATGSKHPIKWIKNGVGSVNVLFSSDNGNNWETIVAGITDNSYLWQLPTDTESNQCVISVVPSIADANVISESSGLFTVNWYPTRPAVPSQWLRRGLLPSPDLNANKGPRIGCVKWVFETDGPVSSQVAVTRPYWDSYWIYIGSEDGNIYSLDDLGELNWICDINTAVVGSPAVGYYWMVYVAGQNGWLYAIDDYGDISWTHKTNAPIYSTPIVGYDGKIYICSEDGSIYALDADGSELWTFTTKGPANLNGNIFATPVIDKNGTVYIGGLYEPNLYALDANNGNIKWVCNFGAIEPNKGQIFVSPAIGPNGIIYQTLVRDSNLYALDPCTGNILWSTSLLLPFDMNSSGWSSPVVGSDGTIYVSFDDPYLRAVEPNGTIKWITRLGLIGGFTLSIDRDNKIYAASDDNFVCVVDSNGLEVSRFKGNNWVSFPAIAEDGTLIVSDANNRVWAITSNSCDGQSPVLHRPADLRADNMVDFVDFAVLAQSWRDCTDPLNPTLCAAGITKYGLYAPGDVGRDAYTNIWDLNALADEWLKQSEFE